jgi:hypothetical protein
MKSPSVKSFMLRWLSLLALVVLAACGGDSNNDQAPIVFSTGLSGAEETPPNSSQGSGAGVLIFHPNDKTFTASIVTSGVADTAAHIHEAPPGVAGPIIFPLAKAQGSVVWTTSGTLTQPQENTLRAGNYYFNVHSPTFPNGEIRGQIRQSLPSQQQLQQLQQVRQQSQQLEQQLQLIQAQAPLTSISY